jgi:hypothetical protein
VCDALGFDHAIAVELERAIPEVREKTDPSAQENRYEVHLALVEKAGP